MGDSSSGWGEDLFFIVPVLVLFKFFNHTDIK